MQQQMVVGSLGGSTSVVNVSAAQAETTVFMQHLQQYNHDMNQLGSDFAKSHPLPIASFEPDQYLRNDNFDIKPARFDVGRYREQSEISSGTERVWQWCVTETEFRFSWC